MVTAMQGTASVMGAVPLVSPDPDGFDFPAFEQLLTGAARPRRRRVNRLTVLGVTLIVLGALVLTLPVTLTLASMPGLEAHTSYATGVEDTAALKRAAEYDQGLIDHGVLAVGDAPDPFTATDSTPAYLSDERYRSQLGEGDSMAVIRIPRISLDMRIGHGTGEGTLETQAGHVYGTTLPVGDKGNSVIAAHRGLGAMLLFYRLGELRDGDLVYTAAAGRTVAWKVDRISRVEPGSEQEKKLVELTPDRTRLTLYTCDPPGLNTMRLIIGAHRVPYVDSVSVQGQSDPWRPWLAIGLIALTALVISVAVMPRTIVARHAGDGTTVHSRS